ncbi:MAG: 50S ribosomal protein L10 [Chloroflexota bacterium]|nr:MAG: 50S ribosomal protein L10 [Chloroflexota bacterium]
MATAEEPQAEIRPTRGTADKTNKIEALAQQLRDSKGSVLLDYRGLNVGDISKLRNDLREQQVDFHVAKNTLLRIAADRAEVHVAPELLEGPTAIAFGLRDEVTPARLLTEFVRRNRVVSIKGGMIGGRSLNQEQIGRVAELPAREVLLAQLLGALQAPMTQVLGLLQAPAREVVGLAQALADKLEGQGDAGAPA